MDLFTLIAVLYIVYLSTWLAIVCLTDCDILTFLSTYFGKVPGEELSGKVVWVTGASSGIGEGLAKVLARCNALIVLSARRKDELERVKKECLALNPKLKEKDILILDFDILNYSVHEQSFKKVIDHFGKLDVLISNAGRSQRANWQEIELQVDKDLFELNVFSLLSLNRIVVKHFLKVGKGQLAVTSSIAGKVGAPGSGSYTGSKHALHGYFECLRNETRGKIDITMLCPGPVHSSVLKEAFTSQEGQKFDQSHNASDRRMTAERCAYLCLVAITNKLEESWQALFPVVPITYFVLYQPYLTSKILGMLSTKSLFLKLRDNRNTLKKD